MSVEPFGPWIDPMVKRGFVHPRHPERPSWNALAATSGVSVTTITNALKGISRISAEKVQALADALKVPSEEVSQWFSRRAVGAPYEPPAEAGELTLRQRKALDELIRSIVADTRGLTLHEDDDADLHLGRIEQKPS